MDWKDTIDKIVCGGAATAARDVRLIAFRRGAEAGRAGNDFAKIRRIFNQMDIDVQEWLQKFYEGLK